MGNEVSLLSGQVSQLAKTLGVSGDAQDLRAVLMSTAFRTKDGVTNAQMSALLLVANQYGLNPWTKEIYAFPDKHNGIVPVVGVDGWSRIINSHSQFDGMDFTYSDDMSKPQGARVECHAWVECSMYRKDRRHPVVVREYLDETYRPPHNGRAGPWQTHTKRFLRHKAMIQCARVAFGYTGIFDPDEAERIGESESELHEVQPEHPAQYSCEAFSANLPAWTKAIQSGARSASEIIAMVETKGALTDEQKVAIRDAEIIDAEFADPGTPAEGDGK